MDAFDVNTLTWPFQLTNVVHRDMYPLLEPSRPELSARGKSVMVTGVSGGVGQAIAEAWAVAGADAVVITGRRLEVLERVAGGIREKVPGAKVVVRAADLRSGESVRELWAHAREALGGGGGAIDVLVNDAGTMNLGAAGDMDPEEWWNDFETNVKGTFLMCHHFLKQAAGGKGTVITVSTGAAASTLPNMSSYISSKLAQIKFMEIFQAENPGLRCFTALPGLLTTDMTVESFLPFAKDDPMLTGGLSLFLSTPRADWMKGGIMSVNWDIEEMEAHKEEILRENRNKLSFVNAKLQKGGHPWSS